VNHKITRLVFFGVLILFCIDGCSNSIHSPTDVKIPQNSDEARKLLAEAQKLYGDGVIYNMRGQWNDARDAFDKALAIISQLDLEYCDEVSDEVDALLREIAYDYRFTLSRAETLTVVSAPVVLSLALSEAPFSELTQKRLKQLMDELPSDTSGIPHDYPIVINDRVKEKIVFFQNEANEPLTRWLGRSYKYMPMILEIFAEEKLPLDLAYLPLIESGFNPTAYSWAHAVGVWQFIKSTAQGYDLKVTWWLDERRDPEKSTRAAAKYLKRLYGIFGDWHLALAAYNCGEGRVQRSMKKQEVDNYWDLDLPTQTENYVPLYIAALLIAKEPAKYGFTGIVPGKKLESDVVWVNEVVDLKLAARCANTTFDTLKMLNPELVRSCTPPKVDKYPLCVPKNKGNTFVENYKKVPESEKMAWARHKVKKGESLWTIARRYGTSVQALIDANSVKNPKALRLGSYLLIPVDRITADKIAASNTTGTKKSSKSSSYKVKPGDTPSEIAEKFDISTSSLLAVNGLNSKSIIRVGQKLKIPGKGKSLNSQTKENVAHTVKKGESLWSIARKYSVTVSQVKKWNKLKSDRLDAGQKLTIVLDSSNRMASSTKSKSSNKDRKFVHTVESGESLWSIARKYKVTISEIKDWNSLKTEALQIGQKLTIYGDSKIAQNEKSDEKVVHTVSQGETLWEIAKKYGTSTDTIIKSNGINDPLQLRPGDRLTIVVQ